MLKKITSCLIAIPLILTGCTEQKPITDDNSERYYIKKDTLINKEQGYYFKIPEGFSLNEEFYPYNLRLESTDTVIEFYTENTEGFTGVQSYIGYTNKAITENEIDYSDIQTFEQGKATILTWSRDKLSKIENDKNHYLKIDIIAKDSTVHTILAKSNQKITDYEAYLDNFKIIRQKGSFEPAITMKKRSQRAFNEETEKLFDDYFLNSDKLSWGIFKYEFISNDDLKKFEKKIDHDFKFLLWYTDFLKEYNPKFVRGFLDKAYKDNKIVELTLQPALVHEPGNDLFRVLNGDYDAFLDEYAKDVADFAHPVLFRFSNEMNGDWCEYSGYRMSLDTELYRELYKYVYSFFQKHNADNVIWVWNPNGKSFPDFTWNAEDMYFPGSEYVDVLGLTFYNTGNYYEGEKWIEFDDLYSELYENSLKKYDMPFMITEFSSARAGGSKEEWTRTMLSSIEKYDNIKLAIWWHGADYTPDGEIARSYFIDDSEEMVEIFREYFAKQ